MAGNKKMGEGTGTLATGSVESGLPAGAEQSQRAGALKKQLADKVRAEPAVAGRLVQAWIREAEKS
jgi:hypothetical protein